MFQATQERVGYSMSLSGYWVKYLVKSSKFQCLGSLKERSYNREMGEILNLKTIHGPPFNMGNTYKLAICWNKKNLKV